VQERHAEWLRTRLRTHQAPGAEARP
jgi:hypothetical protein